MPKPTAAQKAKLPPALLKAIAAGKTGAVKPRPSKSTTSSTRKRGK